MIRIIATIAILFGLAGAADAQRIAVRGGFGYGGFYRPAAVRFGFGFGLGYGYGLGAYYNPYAYVPPVSYYGGPYPPTVPLYSSFPLPSTTYQGYQMYYSQPTTTYYMMEYYP